MTDTECTVKNSGFDPGGNGDSLRALGEGTQDQVCVWKCSVEYGGEGGKVAGYATPNMPLQHKDYFELKDT